MASYKLVIEFSLIGEGVCQEKSNEVGDFKPILLWGCSKGSNGGCLGYLLQWYKTIWSSPLADERETC